MPINCKKCNRDFSSNFSLNRHFKSFHPQNNNDNNEEILKDNESVNSDKDSDTSSQNNQKEKIENCKEIDNKEDSDESEDEVPRKRIKLSNNEANIDIKIIKSTWNLLQYTIKAARFNSGINLSINQIKEMVRENQDLVEEADSESGSDNEEEDDNNNSETKNDEIEDEADLVLGEVQLKFLYHLVVAANNKVINVSVEYFFSLLDKINSNI